MSKLSKYASLRPTTPNCSSPNTVSTSSSWSPSSPSSPLAVNGYSSPGPGGSSSNIPSPPPPHHHHCCCCWSSCCTMIKVTLVLVMFLINIFTVLYFEFIDEFNDDDFVEMTLSSLPFQQQQQQQQSSSSSFSLQHHLEQQRHHDHHYHHHHQQQQQANSAMTAMNGLLAPEKQRHQQAPRGNRTVVYSTVSISPDEPNRHAVAWQSLNLTTSLEDATLLVWEDMPRMASHFFGMNPLCDALKEIQEVDTYAALTTPSQPTVLQIKFHCRDLFHGSIVGTGNYVGMLYGLRLTARMFQNIHVLISCSDAHDEKANFILPWITGFFPAKEARLAQEDQQEQVHVPLAIRNNVPPWPTTVHACEHFAAMPYQYMMDEMRFELRRMAVALVGVPAPDHPSADFVQEIKRREESLTNRGNVLQVPVTLHDLDNPIFPNTELDDAVLHFRCGDVLNNGHRLYGYLGFSDLASMISPAARTIGIVTQPFRAGQKRHLDGGNDDKCEVVVKSLQEYLQFKFPAAVVTIRNDAAETMAVAYARFIMANQSIAGGVSTFPLWPVMATFGTGYLRRPNEADNMLGWLLKPPLDLLTDNVVLVQNQTLIPSTDMAQLWRQDQQDLLRLLWAE